MRTAFLFISALVVGCSATTSETLKVRGQKPVSTEASPLSSAQPLAPVASPPKAWGVAFTRPCVGSLTPPIVSPDGKELAFCGRRFDAQSGAFIDTQSINVGALLAGGRVLSNDYGEQGWTVATRGGKPTSSAAGSYSESLAISPAGKRFIALGVFAIAVNTFGAITFDRAHQFYDNDRTQTVLFQPD